jgi:hypothetical protein
LLHALRTLNASQKFEFVRGLGRAKHLLTELKRGQDLLAFKAVTSALPLDRPTRSSLLRDLNLAIAAKRREARADLNYRTAIPGKAPALDAVPAWFAQLARFFQLSVQLLAAMTIALVFTRRGRLENVEEQRLGIAMLFAFVGGLAGLVGSLPELHRGLQAFLLGYVVAGLAAVVTALRSAVGAQQ